MTRSYAVPAVSIIEGAIREAFDEATATRKFWECFDKVKRGEMTEELAWSDEGDLSFVFKPVTT